MGPQSGGRCRQVVVIRKWSLVQVGLYRRPSSFAGVMSKEYSSNNKPANSEESLFRTFYDICATKKGQNPRIMNCVLNKAMRLPEIFNFR